MTNTTVTRARFVTAAILPILTCADIVSNENAPGLGGPWGVPESFPGSCVAARPGMSHPLNRTPGMFSGKYIG